MLQAVRPKVRQKASETQLSTATQTQTHSGNSTRQITQTESLGVVKLLLEVGLGCVTFLRGIFPEKCFKDDRVDMSRLTGARKEGKSSVRVKVLQRGIHPPCDELLDYLENGINDALTKGYLKTLMIAIYLDPENPTNVVELYTFNFVYRNIGPDGSVRIPELEIRDALRDMSLCKIGGADPGPAGISGMECENADGASYTARNEKEEWTVAKVRGQVQTLVRRLITVTQTLNELPPSRHISFKLYYTDETPPEYEPPHFYCVDSRNAQFTFGTRTAEEQPDSEVVGRLDTGHHCLTLRLATVAHLTPDQDFARNSQQTEIPAAPAVEASQRPVVWDSEEFVIDENAETSFETLNEKAAKASQRQPIGQLDQHGILTQLRAESVGSVVVMDSQEGPESMLLEGLDENWTNESHRVDKGKGRMQDTLTQSNADQHDDEQEMGHPKAYQRRMSFQYQLPRANPATVADDEATQYMSDSQKLDAAGRPEPSFSQETPQYRPTHVLDLQSQFTQTQLVRDPQMPNPADYMFSLAEDEIVSQLPDNSQTQILPFSSTLPPNARRMSSTFGVSSIFDREAARAVPNLIPAPTDLDLRDQARSSKAKTAKPITVVESDEELDMASAESPIETFTENQTCGAKAEIKAKRPKNNVGHSSIPQERQGQERQGQHDEIDKAASMPKIKGKGKMSSKKRKPDSDDDIDDDNDDQRDRQQEVDEIDCVCLNNAERQDGTPMVACDTCQAWSHLICYGHEGQYVEGNFECYKCQLKAYHDDTSVAMEAYSQLALFRRCIKRAWEGNCGTAQAYVKIVACRHTRQQMFERLQEENVLINEAANKKGSGKTPKRARAGKWVANEDMAFRSEITARYFTAGGGLEADLDAIYKVKDEETIQLAPNAQPSRATASAGASGVMDASDKASEPSLPANVADNDQTASHAALTLQAGSSRDVTDASAARTVAIDKRATPSLPAHEPFLVPSATERFMSNDGSTATAFAIDGARPTPTRNLRDSGMAFNPPEVSPSVTTVPETQEEIKGDSMDLDTLSMPQRGGLVNAQSRHEPSNILSPRSSRKRAVEEVSPARSGLMKASQSTPARMTRSKSASTTPGSAARRQKQDHINGMRPSAYSQVAAQDENECISKKRKKASVSAGIAGTADPYEDSSEEEDSSMA